MQSDQQHSLAEPTISLADQVSYYMQNAPASVFSGINLPQNVKSLIHPFHGVDVQPTDACPKKFIIFDQTNNRSHVMFHPEASSRVFPFGFGFGSGQIDENEVRKVASSIKENSADIDALLSTEDEENKECEDDEVVSTARTDAIYECNSSDSCSSYEPLSNKRKLDNNDKKHKRMRKMVKALRAVVPGANRSTTVAALDEAVQYLRSLMVEVQKLGAGNLKD